MKKIALGIVLVVAVVLSLAVKEKKAEATCYWCSGTAYGCIDASPWGHTHCSSYYNPWAPNGWTCNLFGSCQ